MRDSRKRGTGTGEARAAVDTGNSQVVAQTDADTVTLLGVVRSCCRPGLRHN